MLERERHGLILKLVKERSIISVSDLVDLLGASEATIRRDLNVLDERGAIRRIRGGVEAMQPRLEAHLVGVPFALSQDIHVAQKAAIAAAAAALIEPGDSIIIGGGTTTFALAEFLVEHELDILTNSFPIAAKLLATSRNRITVPGGQIFREQNIILSPFPDDSSRRFRARRLFTGCFGVSRFGVMEADPLIVQGQMRLLERAEQVIILADSSKLRRQSSMVVADLARISTLVTDDGAKPEELEVLQAAGVKTIVAQVADEDGLQHARTA